MGSTFTTEVQISNLALGEVVDDVISALTDNNEAARKCNLYYPLARDEALEIHDWRFATDRATLTRDGASVDISDETTAPKDVVFRLNGRVMYVLGGTSVYQYTLSVPWNPAKASYASKSFDFSTEEATPTGIAFSGDGVKMYMVGTTDDIVEQYTLSTPWDVSTATVDGVQLDVSSEDTAPENVTFGNSGLKLYVVGNTNNTIFEYTLTTAYDLSTASYSTNSISVAAEDTNPVAVAFSSDGLSMFVAGSEADAVHSYTLSTAWDVSTATADSVSLQLVDDDTDLTGMFLNSDGTRLYLVGLEEDTVFQYGMIANDLSTAKTNKPESGFTYRYALPSDHIRSLEYVTAEGVPEPEWVEEDGFVLSNENAFPLKYIKRVTTISRFSPLFVQTLVLTLAAMLSVSLKGDKNLQAQLIARRDGMLRQAELANARTGPEERDNSPHGWTDRDTV
jgi:hypothetical protein